MNRKILQVLLICQLFSSCRFFAGSDRGEDNMGSFKDSRGSSSNEALLKQLKDACTAAVKANDETKANSEQPNMKTCGLPVHAALENNDAYSDQIAVTQILVNKIYQEMEIVDEILDANNIPYTLTGGSLIGVLRNGGLIPGDDDIDIAVHVDHRETIFRLDGEIRARGLKLSQVFFGLKVFSKDTKTPGLDIFFVEEQEVDGEIRLLNVSSEARGQWPSDYYLPSDWENIRTVDFGGLKLSALRLEGAKRYLIRNYGNDWYTVTYKTFDHIRNKVIEKKKVELAAFDYYHLIPWKNQ